MKIKITISSLHSGNQNTRHVAGNDSDYPVEIMSASVEDHIKELKYDLAADYFCMKQF